MYAHRQFYDHAAATIDVPPELQQQCIEVIFIALNLNDVAQVPSVSTRTGQALIDVLQAAPYPSSELPLASSVQLPVRDVIL